MKERPILFSGPMVCALIEGRKTQTRRLVGLSELQPSETPGYDWTWRGQAPLRSVVQQKRYPRGCWQDVKHEGLIQLCPYGAPGDRLWVRETFSIPSKDHPKVRVDFRADKKSYGRYIDGNTGRIAYGFAEPLFPGPGRRVARWTPAIHMPRWASRITLEVTDVRVERLQAITDEDAKAEGVRPEDLDGIGADQTILDEPRRGRTRGSHPHVLSYAVLWDTINGDRALWITNPWVWVVSFRRLEGT